VTYSEGHAHLVGVLGGARLADVDGRGILRPERVNWELAWWIGADDRWHFPDEEVAVRQSLLDGMPVVVTAMRVPGGDAVHRVYGGSPGSTVVEIANDSPAPFVVALVVRGAAHVETEGSVIVVDQRPAIVATRPPARWAVSTDGTTEQIVSSGNARAGVFAPRTDRAARLEAAFLFPVTHRTRARFALALGREIDGSTAAPPEPEQVARGWRAQLRRGMQVELPDAALQVTVDSARSQTLLAGQAWIVPPEIVVALEDWGFDDEARAAWKHLGVLSRRKASRRLRQRASWTDVRRLSYSGGAAFLTALRSALLHESGAVVGLLAEWPAEWRGHPLDVGDAPTRLGPVSYSLRWHGDRVALMWEAPPNVALRIPAFDPGWSSTEPRGETLLSPAA
jgi:hypothetical protein